MSGPRLDEWTGERAVGERLERWLAGDPRGARALAASRLRELVRLDFGAGRALLVKRFRGTPAPREAEAATARRRPWKRWLGRRPALREWRSLRELADRGVAVPPALGLARSGGDDLLVLEYLDGAELESLLSAPVRERRGRLAEVGRLVASLHRAGRVHGDLHTGNLRLTADGPVLLDLQRARSTGTAAARLADLGALDFSLFHNGFSLGDRTAFRVAALGLERAPGRRSAGDRERLRRVARAGQRRARAYYASRTRRCGRPGRRFAAFRADGERGLRSRAIDASAVHAALAAHDLAKLGSEPRDGTTDVLKRDHRSCIAAVRLGDHALVVKEVVKTGLLRRLADRVRGSPARRAWRAGHGLACRGIGVATPLAYVEEWRFGVPVRSRIVMEDLRPAPVASDPAVWSAGPERPLQALGRLLRALHRHGVEHGDLQALHVHLLDPEDGGAPLRPILIDLEGVRFRRRLDDRRRLRALAELNASLPDDFVGSDVRREAFDCYARALPFSVSNGSALRSLVRASLAREHHWSGSDCELAP